MSISKWAQTELLTRLHRSPRTVANRIKGPVFDVSMITEADDSEVRSIGHIMFIGRFELFENALNQSIYRSARRCMLLPDGMRGNREFIGITEKKDAVIAYQVRMTSKS